MKINKVNKMKLDVKEALELCEQLRTDNKKKLLSYNKLWCWGCAKFAKSPENRCFSNSEEGTNTGCSQVNKLYNRLRG
jgi:hypothetical protein